MSILTLSRLYGSGGSEVAALVAKNLGWSLLDNTVVDSVAARIGLSVAEVRDREERVPSLVERLLAMAMGSRIGHPNGRGEASPDDQLIESHATSSRKRSRGDRSRGRPRRAGDAGGARRRAARILLRPTKR